MTPHPPTRLKRLVAGNEEAVEAHCAVVRWFSITNWNSLGGRRRCGGRGFPGFKVRALLRRLNHALRLVLLRRLVTDHDLQADDPRCGVDVAVSQR
jgi:hypothetical protein